MSKHYFMINEVAQLHNITRKALHYYDRIGLFSPEYTDQETGYRYYKREQFPYLKQIIYLKDLGFTLTDIKRLLDERNFDVLISELDERLVSVNNKLKTLSDTKRDLEFLINQYNQVKHLDERDFYRPSVKIFNERIFCYQLCEGETSVESVMLAYRVILRNLIDNDLFSQMNYGTIYFETDNLQSNAGAFITLPETLGLENETVQAAGKYVSMYKKGGYHDPESIMFLLDWIEKEGYVVEGPIFDYSLIDYTFSDDEKEMVQEIQIKVR